MMTPQVTAISAGEDSDIEAMQFAEPHFRRDRVNNAGRVMMAAMGDDYRQWDNDKWDEYYDS
jgi:hypothetical protein